MATKLKNSIKKYFTEVWLIEVIIVLLIGGYFCNELYNSKKSTSYLVNLIEEVKNPEKVYREKLKNESALTSAIIYDKTNSLKKIYYGTDKEKQDIESYFKYNPNTMNTEITNKAEKFMTIPKNIYFIIRNKETNEVISNDIYVSKNKYTQNEIMRYINNKYSGKGVCVFYDNSKNFNEVVSKDKTIDKDDVIGHFEEYYYTASSRYNNENNIRLLKFITFIGIIGILLLLKIIIVLIVGRKNINTKFIKNTKYIISNALKYKETKKIIITTIICLVVFYIFYLYLIAEGGYEKNILVNFFTMYPFKGSLLLILCPLIVLFYSVKKIIEVKKVTEALKCINDGNLECEIPEGGSNEIVELVENIKKLKKGYELAVEDTLKNERLKTELISNVSHDLRTPLTSIINYVNILQQDNVTEEERKEYLTILEKKSKKLKVLIDDLFEMSKINSGKMKLNKENIDIMSLIHQAIGEYSFLYEDKNIEFKVESNYEEIIMSLDGKMISRAIENIVINSLKYSLEKTRVYVDVEKTEKEVKIAFKNIANYDMDFDDNEIFERFVRADKSRNSNIEGSGLGLAITKSIVELHGGVIKVEREGDMFKIFIILPI